MVGRRLRSEAVSDLFDLFQLGKDELDPVKNPVSCGSKMFTDRSPVASDELCKQAKSNDYWLHVIGTTGSHVIIPARRVGSEAPPALIRAAAILALHHSKLRADQRGEVYVTRRQHIRKRKGMPPGLWQVDQADTLFVAYTDDELAATLAGAQP